MMNRLLTVLLALLLHHEVKTLRKEIWATAENLLILLSAAILALTGGGFLIGALYLYLRNYLPPAPASAFTGVFALALGAVIYALSRWRQNK